MNPQPDDPFIIINGGRWDGAELVLVDWSGPPPEILVDDETGKVFHADTHELLGTVK